MGAFPYQTPWVPFGTPNQKGNLFRFFEPQNWVKWEPCQVPIEKPLTPWFKREEFPIGNGKPTNGLKPFPGWAEKPGPFRENLELEPTF